MVCIPFDRVIEIQIPQSKNKYTILLHMCNGYSNCSGVMVK